MAFRIPNTAKTWFKHIKSKQGSNTGFELDFDIHYFCLMAGLHTQRKEDLTASETTEIVQYFPSDYKKDRHLIIALFLKKELEQLGVSLKERKLLNNQLKILISTTSATRLSDQGMRELNKYANGGFRVLQEHFLEPPRTLENFLITFNKLFTKSEP
ncbi:hypothetical protein BFP97_16880 [Roseivirga sp. 4D4]|uniref:hypothetical protein n=1 Tax=Roseivirga sp. 4D4 TaxID=1889784 RepID=UPI00085354B1|nr:hypothetical protein [Roseivirga sp. 4D4]OEK03093.1 hypothetical protein BFP97_16880 [Roseivirga sp. 4D4]